jgi:hypothetical protein
MSQPGRPFFPASWVEAVGDGDGLAYFHQGTPKHWVSDGVLSNLLAWGEHTDAIGNRLDSGRWPKTFDQRLNGVHVLRMGLYPHAGDWRAADVPGMARAFANPLLACQQHGAGGDLPARGEVLALVGRGFAATAVVVEDERLVCRGYGTEQPAETAYRLKGLQAEGWRALTGTPIERLKPFQIGTLVLTRAAATEG